MIAIKWREVPGWRAVVFGMVAGRSLSRHKSALAPLLGHGTLMVVRRRTGMSRRELRLSLTSEHARRSVWPGSSESIRPFAKRAELHPRSAPLGPGRAALAVPESGGDCDLAVQKAVRIRSWWCSGQSGLA